MSHASPQVSVIMPAYNAADFLAEAVQSVQRQTYPHWELWVIDDASTDGTANVLRGFNEDPRIHALRVTRQGSPAKVRNIGLQHAQGDAIAFLDADDVYFPHALETLVGTLQQNPTLDAVFGFAEFMDESHQPLCRGTRLLPQEGGGWRFPPGYRIGWPELVQWRLSCLLPGLMVRKAVFQELGGFNESLYGPEDYEFYARLFIRDFAAVRCIPAYIYHYRVYTRSLTNDPKRYQAVLDSHLRVMDWLYTAVDLPPEAHRLKAQAYMARYRYLARERLLHHQPAIARLLLKKARQDTRIPLSTWLPAAGPLWLRSWIPSTLDTWMVDTRWRLRHQRISTPLGSVAPLGWF